MSMRKAVLTVFLMSLFIVPAMTYADQTIEANIVKSAPVIDGKRDDAAWKGAHSYTIRDKRLNVDVTLKAVRTVDSVFFLVSFPDKVENRLHKPWVWSKDLEVYQIGPQREDTFTFKWNMSGKKISLSNFSNNDYQADVWYWKANRTDPAGYADDKLHILSSEASKKSLSIVSASGKQRYLLRLGDEGQTAQKKRLLTDYQGEVQDQYISQAPGASRADVRAKGVWKNGMWTIEFARKLDTGNDDDISFESTPGKKYLFGISIAGLYAEKIDPNKKHPYGQGRISEPLYLVLK
jgi:hypothetical protein